MTRAVYREMQMYDHPGSSHVSIDSKGDSFTSITCQMLYPDSEPIQNV